MKMKKFKQRQTKLESRQQGRKQDSRTGRKRFSLMIFAKMDMRGYNIEASKNSFVDFKSGYRN
jgi:hypothetical protein